MGGCHTVGWGYWYWTDPFNNGSEIWSDEFPGVDLYKYTVDSRWMTHGCERWNKNHTNYLQTAFLNGVGFNMWENVWGIWNGVVPRDGELFRRATAIQRHYGPKYLASPSWEPYYEYNDLGDGGVEDGVFASFFP